MRTYNVSLFLPNSIVAPSGAAVVLPEQSGGKYYIIRNMGTTGVDLANLVMAYQHDFTGNTPPSTFSLSPGMDLYPVKSCDIPDSAIVQVFIV